MLKKFIALMIVACLFGNINVYAYGSESTNSEADYIYNTSSDREIIVDKDENGDPVITIINKSYNPNSKDKENENIINFLSRDNRPKFYTYPTWKPWRNIGSISVETGGRILEFALLNSLGATIGMFTNISAKLVSALVNLGSITGVADGYQAAKSLDKNGDGRLTLQTRVKSDIYGNIQRSEHRIR